MLEHKGISRRGFIGGAAALGYLALKSPAELIAETARGERTHESLVAALSELDDYDALAKLSFNENPYGPPDSVLKAMTVAFKYANRYGYPDGDVVQAIAKHHDVKPENVVLSAGSGELLDVMG